MEAAKEELETRLANEQLSKPPKISAEFMTFLAPPFPQVGCHQAEPPENADRHLYQCDLSLR